MHFSHVSLFLRYSARHMCEHACSRECVSGEQAVRAPRVCTLLVSSLGPGVVPMAASRASHLSVPLQGSTSSSARLSGESQPCGLRNILNATKPLLESLSRLTNRERVDRSTTRYAKRSARLFVAFLCPLRVAGSLGGTPLFLNLVSNAPDIH